MGEKKKFMIRKRCCKEPQFIVKPVPRIALEQEEIGSNKAIEELDVWSKWVYGIGLLLLFSLKLTSLCLCVCTCTQKRRHFFAGRLVDVLIVRLKRHRPPSRPTLKVTFILEMLFHNLKADNGFWCHNKMQQGLST